MLAKSGVGVGWTRSHGGTKELEAFRLFVAPWEGADPFPSEIWPTPANHRSEPPVLRVPRLYAYQAFRLRTGETGGQVRWFADGGETFGGSG